MGNIIKRLWFGVIWMCIYSLSFAQQKTDTSNSSVNEVMRSNNKIYVVMAVCFTILLGLILYLVRIDRKLTKIEKV
jgi:hypothetical protein